MPRISALGLHFLLPMAREAPTKPIEASSPRKSSAGLFLTIALAALLGGAGAAWMYLQRHPAQSANADERASAPKYLVHLEGFTVNLADPEETHFLRVTMDLGIDRLPKDADREKASASLPAGRIRDAILSVLTTCKADELLTPEGKSELKKRLVEAVNRAVPEIGVREVYFTEFLVQR
jgi:flagellar FliL protein